MGQKSGYPSGCRDVAVDSVERKATDARGTPARFVLHFVAASPVQPFSTLAVVRPHWRAPDAGHCTRPVRGRGRLSAGILSDLHIELAGKTLPSVSAADVVVLAGDLAPVRTHRIGKVMRTWHYPDLLYVPGNHEWHGSEIDSARLKLARQCRDHGVELLDPGVVDVDDVRFVGATLWTDFRLDPTPRAEAWAHHEVGVSMPDFEGAIRHHGGERGDPAKHGGHIRCSWSAPDGETT